MNLPQLDYLVKQGCDEVQGYLLAKPMPPDALERWLNEWLARPQAMKVPRPRADAASGDLILPAGASGQN